jgi:hypothetical protein
MKYFDQGLEIKASKAIKKKLNQVSNQEIKAFEGLARPFEINAPGRMTA